ncbi:hypothetical protein CRG98_010495 [Punica granatum]|uniref:PPM-type phosphatase domain-containing protein n=1 Tax=Punica granatum TaxID=22663 RepID=A0A2I0KLE0_PUNGR|nr:hypothetical protein CRG98_010495 [Punica granatum]
MTNQHRVADEDELYRRIEYIIDTRLVRRLNVVLDRLSERMETLMEARQEVNPRLGRVPNPTDPSDDAFFVVGGDRELEFDAEEEEEDKGDDKGYNENRKFDEFEGNDVGLFAFAEYDEDDKEADAVWEAINKRMDLRRKDRREARLKQEIEKYRASNQQMRTRMSDVSIEQITAAEYFESRFFPIIRSRAWADIGFRSSMEDVYVCVDNFAHDYGFENLCGGPNAVYDEDFPHEIENVISSAFLQTYAAFAEACSLDAAFASRTIALAATVMGRLLVVANIGDCRAVQCRQGKAIEMSRDHKLVCAKERKQIEASGGYVYDGYLNGQLNAILSLGRNFISGLLRRIRGRILSTQERMMRQKT